MKVYTKVVYVAAGSKQFVFPTPLPDNVKLVKKGESYSKDHSPATEDRFYISGSAIELEGHEEFEEIEDRLQADLGMGIFDVLNGQGLALEYGDTLKKPFVVRTGRASAAEVAMHTATAILWCIKQGRTPDASKAAEIVAEWKAAGKP